MHQSRKGSAIESIANIIIGYFVAIGSQIIIFPLFNIHIPLSENFIIGGYFTVVSLIRSYTLRRVFTKRKVFPKREVVTIQGKMEVGVAAKNL